jgi:hypothetical protein
VQSYQFKQFVKECLLLLLSKKRLPRLKEKAIGAVSGSATKQRFESVYAAKSNDRAWLSNTKYVDKNQNNLLYSKE